MKKILVLAFVLCLSGMAEAQIGKSILKKVKDKVEGKAGDKNDKKTEDPKSENPNSENKPADESGKKDAASGEPATIRTYSKYDFVPGENIIWFEDFAQDAIGDFPDKWNTNGSGEIVTIEGQTGHWFMPTRIGFFVPEFINSFPDNFTLEFDLLCDNLVHSWGLYASINELKDPQKLEEWQSADNRFTLQILPGGDGNGSCSYDRRKAGQGEGASSTSISHFADKTRPVHVAIWRQKERVRVYMNEDKTWDIPKGIIPEAKLNSLIFWIQNMDPKNHFLISNLRLAVGAPDTRNKLLTEGKWVTHGILFDVNSDKLKPESFGTLKEIAGVLKENADVKVKIIGHTDSDGDEAKNLDLSKRRATSVKDALVKEFGIDEGRMQTDGMGESKPVDKNDTPAGKANNRRVEFIKL